MSEERKSRPWFRLGCLTFLVLLLLCGGAIAFLPEILSFIDFPVLSFDLSKNLSDSQKALFTNHTAVVRLDVTRPLRGDLCLTGRGQLLDWPFSLKVRANYSLLRREADATLDFGFDLKDSPWHVHGRFAGSMRDGWAAEVNLPETPFDEHDPVLGPLVRRLAGSGVSDLAFDGRLALEARAFTTNALPLPTWKAAVRLSDFNAKLKAGETEFALANLRIRPSVGGLGPASEIGPLFVRADSLSAGGVVLSNAFASIRATETAFLVTEAGSDVFGGQVRLYALFLDPVRLNTGFTLFMDDIDTGRVLNHLYGIRGRATGRLHGKLPLRVRNGSEVAFGDSYLYSIPGETGTIQLDEAAPILDNLALGGVSKDARDNLEKALRNLTYTALKFNLNRDGDDDQHALSFKLEGSATSGKTTVPVNFNITLRGPLNRLVNTGLQISGK